MRGLLFLTVFFLFFLPLLQVQARECTAMGCIDGVTFRGDPFREWKDGVYNFDFSLDFKQVHCRASLPLNPCGERSVKCDEEGIITIGEYGCALPKSQHAFGDIIVHGDPRKVIVRISRNNIPIVTHTVVVNYQEFMPNGIGCGPVCHSASYNLFDASSGE